MSRIHHRISVLIPLLAGLTLAVTGYAQAPSALASDEDEPVYVETPKPKKERAVSSGVASALAAASGDDAVWKEF